MHWSSSKNSISREEQEECIVERVASRVLQLGRVISAAVGSATSLHRYPILGLSFKSLSDLIPSHDQMWRRQSILDRDYCAHEALVRAHDSQREPREHGVSLGR